MSWIMPNEFLGTILRFRFQCRFQCRKFHRSAITMIIPRFATTTHMIASLWIWQICLESIAMAAERVRFSIMVIIPKIMAWIHSRSRCNRGQNFKRRGFILNGSLSLSVGQPVSVLFVSKILVCLNCRWVGREWNDSPLLAWLAWHQYLSRGQDS